MKKKRMMYLAIFLVCAAFAMLLFTFAVPRMAMRTDLAYMETINYEDLTEDMSVNAENLMINLEGCDRPVTVYMSNSYGELYGDATHISILVHTDRNPWERFEIFNYTPMGSLIIKTTRYSDQVVIDRFQRSEVISYLRRAIFYLGEGDDYLGIMDGVMSGRDIPFVLTSYKIYCGPGNDHVIGSRRDDVIFGGDGDDALYGKGGNDIIYGGPGNDLLDGGEGEDRLNGGAGRNTIIQ